jgi:TonB family protein
MCNGALQNPHHWRKSMGIPSPFHARQDSPLVQKLAIETDRRLIRSVFGSGGIWVVLLAFLASLPPARIAAGHGTLPNVILVPEDDTTIVKWVPPRTYLDKPKVVKRPSPPNSGRAAVSTHPTKENGILNNHIISSNKKISGKSVYEIVHNTIKDLPKLESFGFIRHDSKTRIASGRKGVLSTEYNPGYDIKDGDGNLDMTGNLGSVSRIVSEVPEMPKPNLSLREQSITHTQEEGWRSTASIWAVVKSHSPGLRHLYNQHLRTQPGLQGKVSVRFGIDARGTVVSAAIEGSTTGYDRFDEAILQAVRSWRFEPIRHLGVEEVLVPLQFSE